MFILISYNSYYTTYNKEVKLIVDYKTPFIMGNEFAGMIEKVGSNVAKFKVGDRVYARMPLDKIGTFAECGKRKENIYFWWHW